MVLEKFSFGIYRDTLMEHLLGREIQKIVSNTVTIIFDIRQW